jgi:MIP family channel proteins
MLRGTAREAAAEFLGTFVLIVFGCGSVAQSVLSGGEVGSPMSIHLSWGLAVTMAVYCAGGVSGAHINPAVTLAMTVFRKFPVEKVLPYMLAQIAGAFVAAAVVYAVYADAFSAFDGGTRQVLGETGTAGVFATYPAAHIQAFPGGFVDQVAGTALLLLVLFGLTDRRNMHPSAHMGPFMVGALVALIGMSFGFNAGYAINPARDLGPRIFTWIAGWGDGVWTAGGSYWWVPIAGPLLGAVIGGAIYDFLITRNHPADSAEPG